MEIRAVGENDKEWIRKLSSDHWGSPIVITRGKAYQVDSLDGFIAIIDDKRSGLITFNIEDDECEIVALNSLTEGIGIGKSLIEAIKRFAESRQCRRLWMVTTNDNTPARSFYQKLGFRICAVYKGAIDQYRKLKPEIPIYGIDSIPIRDEIELEMMI
ncbi:MAG: GNAT family N-acetyltransferase [candidate division Zixibacteria bacterium]|nr:GNAT family N-acetyltransferase [candidate division Zixibacteria bacterium]